MPLPPTSGAGMAGKAAKFAAPQDACGDEGFLRALLLLFKLLPEARAVAVGVGVRGSRSLRGAAGDGEALGEGERSTDNVDAARRPTAPPRDRANVGREEGATGRLTPPLPPSRLLPLLPPLLPPPCC